MRKNITRFRVLSMPQKLLGMIVGAVILLAGCGDSETGFGPKTRIGDRAPVSENLIVEDENDWYRVSSMDTKVPLYRWRISDLVEQGKPFLVVFGTPQHCTMCVDQIVRVAVMEEKYRGRFAFIHVDGYKDTGVWVEWGIQGEPWTFIVDGNGIVRKVFPGQTELALLEAEVVQLLKEAGYSL